MALDPVLVNPPLRCGASLCMIIPFLITFLRNPLGLIQSIKIHNSVIANKPIESRLGAWLIEQKTLIMIYVESA